MISRVGAIRDVTRLMRGISVRKFGDPEVMKLIEDLPIPEPNENQIQIRVHAAGVNPLDTYIRSGKHERKPDLPYTPGFDGAGIITKLGKNVKDFKIGERVFTVDSESGTYAQYTICKPGSVFSLPENLSYDQGSALGTLKSNNLIFENHPIENSFLQLGIPYFTACKSLYVNADAKSNETVLVHGASGSTGIACVQVAKAIGLNVIGTAGTEEGIKLVKNIGADYAFNHRDKDYIEKIKESFPDGIDIILEMAGHSNLNTDLELLKYKQGRVVVIGNKAPIEINPRLIMAKETKITGFFIFKSDQDEFKILNSHLQSLIRKATFHPVLAKTYDLGQAAQAHHDVIYKNGSLGRLTLKID